MITPNKQIPALLIAFLCLPQCKSPSNEIMDAFKTADSSLSISTEYLNNSIDKIYPSIDSNRSNHLTYALYADSVYFTTKNTCNYLDSLKNILKTKDTTGENIDLATNMLIKSATGDTLLQKLSSVCKYAYSSLIDKSKKGELDSALVTIREIQVDKNWKKKYFESVPTFAAMTILSSFKNDCINAATITLRDIKEHMSQ
jgi:hypothetical protein